LKINDQRKNYGPGVTRKGEETRDIKHKLVIAEMKRRRLVKEAKEAATYQNTMAARMIEQRLANASDAGLSTGTLVSTPFARGQHQVSSRRGPSVESYCIAFHEALDEWLPWVFQAWSHLRYAIMHCMSSYGWYGDCSSREEYSYYSGLAPLIKRYTGALKERSWRGSHGIRTPRTGQCSTTQRLSSYTGSWNAVS